MSDIESKFQLSSLLLHQCRNNNNNCEISIRASRRCVGGCESDRGRRIDTNFLFIYSRCSRLIWWTGNVIRSLCSIDRPENYLRELMDKIRTIGKRILITLLRPLLTVSLIGNHSLLNVHGVYPYDTGEWIR